MNNLHYSSAFCDIKQSYYQYAFNCEKGIGTDVNYDKALCYYKLGAEDGNTKCMVRYGLMHELDKGVDEDPVEATKYYKIAADKDEYDGYYNYVTMLNSGSGIEQNQEEVTKNFTEVCHRGYHVKHVMLRFGYALYKGIGVQEDLKEACVYFKQADVQGDKNTLFFFGFMLINGYGENQNIKEGWRFVRNATDKENEQVDNFWENYFNA